jgi:type II secretory pathway pseudopilin PulG
MRTQIRRHHEKGAALIIALILISVASLIAVSSMRGSRTQEMMTSNQNNKLISHMAAEAGASRFVAWVTDPDRSSNLGTDWANRNTTLLPATRNTTQADVPPFGYFWIGEEPTWTDNPFDVTVVGAAWMNELLAETQLRFSVSVEAGSSSPMYQPFADAGVVGCEGVATRGSGQIDSYDSGTGS